MSFLQSQIGDARVVDPYLLQACDIASPQANLATATALKTCLGIP